MSIEVKVPVLPESIADATISAWHKKVGDTVNRDENLVDLETDKVVLEVPAPQDGVLTEIREAEGATVIGKQIIAVIEAGSGSKKAAAAPTSADNLGSSGDNKPTASSNDGITATSPSVRKFIHEQGLEESAIKGTGKGGRISKDDVENHIKGLKSSSAPSPGKKPDAAPSTNAVAISSDGPRTEKRVPMTRLRARIAERLLQAQSSAAILTTFNEINMKPVMDLRTHYKEKFEKQHGVKLGFMSFFVKAAVEALKRYPAVNASIDGSDIVYHGYFDIGVAVSSPRGLVVPILRNAEQLNMADIETRIVEFGAKAKNGSLSVEEITGGTFTISNGGVFGSLLSTPILNPPQSAILGMHKTMERPIVENGEIVIRPMMYLALSYDHRIIDGKEAVQFLVSIKELLEDPARMLLEI